jgi:hypothetical protein
MRRSIVPSLPLRLVFPSHACFLYSTFLFCFIMQILSINSSIKNFNKHVLIDHFHFKHETRMKEKLLKSQSGHIISLPCSVIIQLQNCDVM